MPLLVRSGQEELLVYNFRKTVPIFALNRYFFVRIQLITGKSMGEGITRFRIVSDSMCKPTPEPVSTFRRFTVFSRFLSIRFSSKPTFETGPESAKTGQNRLL